MAPHVQSHNTDFVLHLASNQSEREAASTGTKGGSGKPLRRKKKWGIFPHPSRKSALLTNLIRANTGPHLALHRHREKIAQFLPKHTPAWQHGRQRHILLSNVEMRLNIYIVLVGSSYNQIASLGTLYHIALDITLAQLSLASKTFSCQTLILLYILKNFWHKTSGKWRACTGTQGMDSLPYPE